MKWLLARLTSTRGFRAAARRVAEDPSAENYLALARESVQRGEPGRVEAVCHEALALHPGHAGLKATLARATRMRLDERGRQLQRELADAPRPALWRELVEIELQTGRARRAVSLAERWDARAPSGASAASHALAVLHVFRESALRADAERSWELAGVACERDRDQVIAHQVRCELAHAVSAHAAERAALARLIELQPGRADLEARYREALARVGGQPSFAAALEATSRGGVVSTVGSDASADQEVEETSLAGVRPGLQALVASGAGLCASYHRGGTALVQGMTGATADRTARSVRDLTRAARGGVRRLGLGPLRGVRLIGEHGDLAIRAGGAAAAAAIAPVDLPEPALETLETLAQWEVRP